MAVWLQDALGLDPLIARGLQLVVAFLFVIAAILVVLALIRRRAGRRLAAVKPAQRRLGLVEAISVDDVRRLVLVRRDQVEHLLLIGGPTDLVVEASIARPVARQGAPATAPQASPPPRAATAPPSPAPPPSVATVEREAVPARPAAAAEPALPVPPAAPRPPAIEPPAQIGDGAVSLGDARPPPERSLAAAPRLPADPPAVEPRPRADAALDLRPVRPTAPTEPTAPAPRPPARDPLPRTADAPPARTGTDRPRPVDDVIRPERR